MTNHRNGAALGLLPRGGRPTARVLSATLLLLIAFLGETAQADLFVANASTEVLQFNGMTGEFTGVFTAGGGLSNSNGLTFGPSGDLFVASSDTDQILRFDGVTGAFAGTFASGGGLSVPYGLVFGPNGDLFVTSANNNNVLKFDALTGAFEGVFATGGPGKNGRSSLVFNSVPEPSSGVPKPPKMRFTAIRSLLQAGHDNVERRDFRLTDVHGQVVNDLLA